MKQPKDQTVTEEQKEECKEDVTEEELTNETVEEESTSKALAEEYLNLARVIQADFDNYRKRSLEQIDRAKLDGISSAVEVLLPSLDAFKQVKNSVKDEQTIEGINMLERAIIAGFEKLGVQKIEAVGQMLDPNIHNVLAVTKNEEQEDGIILEELQAGYKLNDKIIRCSQVLVNKLD